MYKAWFYSSVTARSFSKVFDSEKALDCFIDRARSNGTSLLAFISLR